MSRISDSVPDPTAMLCEHCGYIVSHLPGDHNCPECGRPITDSLPSLRKPSHWETSPRVGTLLTTTARVLFTPGKFFRSLSPGPNRLSARFAWVHWGIAAALLGSAAWLHLMWMLGGLKWLNSFELTLAWLALPALAGLTGGLLWFTVWLAGHLTAWEAAYRGLRLPFARVMRAQHYHAAAYLPVGLVALLVTGGYRVLLDQRIIDDRMATKYLYLLCAMVILSAAYLFQSYWIAMRRMMYANDATTAPNPRLP